MSFYNEIYITLSIVVSILLIILFFLGFKLKEKLINRFGTMGLLGKFSSFSFRIYRKKALLTLLTVFLLFAALARPQWGTKPAQTTRKGLDILVLLDVSSSMLAEDMKPTRLSRAKHAIAGLLDLLQGDRIGLLIFAGRSFLQCPLTVDYAAFRMFLEDVDVSSVPTQGTAMAGALERGLLAFPAKEKKHKVMILVTDGEDHEGKVLEAAEKAKEEGIVIYAIGIGSARGELIPVRDAYGAAIGYKKDRAGNPVLSRLDEATLEKAALATGGKYFQASESEFELKKVHDEIMKMEKKTIFGRSMLEQEDRFQWFLLPAALLLLWEIMTRERKKHE